MRRLLSLFAVLCLVLSLATGALAHAAEGALCITDQSLSSADQLYHFDGDGDEVPADGESGLPHHHGGCHGHHLGMEGGGYSASLAAIGRDLPSIFPMRSLGSVYRDTELRPPIA